MSTEVHVFDTPVVRYCLCRFPPSPLTLSPLFVVFCGRLQASLVSLEPRWDHNLQQAMLYSNCGSAGGGCRRAILSMHFGEAPPDCRAMCDLCAARYPGSTAAEELDITDKCQVNDDLRFDAGERCGAGGQSSSLD